MAMIDTKSPKGNIYLKQQPKVPDLSLWVRINTDITSANASFLDWMIKTISFQDLGDHSSLQYTHHHECSQNFIIDFNGMSTCLGFVKVNRLGKVRWSLHFLIASIPF